MMDVQDQTRRWESYRILSAQPGRHLIVRSDSFLGPRGRGVTGRIYQNASHSGIWNIIALPTGFKNTLFALVALP